MNISIESARLINALFGIYICGWFAYDLTHRGKQPAKPFVTRFLFAAAVNAFVLWLSPLPSILAGTAAMCTWYYMGEMYRQKRTIDVHLVTLIAALLFIAELSWKDWFFNAFLIVLIVAINLKHWLGISNEMGYYNQPWIEGFFANIGSVAITVAAIELGPARAFFPLLLGLMWLLCAREILFVILAPTYTVSFWRSSTMLLLVLLVNAVHIFYSVDSIPAPIYPASYFYWIEMGTMTAGGVITAAVLWKNLAEARLGTS